MLIIAHRGASGYLPEHTLAAKAMAHAQGADFLEQDLVITRDDVPIVLHDIHLDTVTDVAARFPGRSRSDGRWYALDFTLADIRTLTVSERFDPRTKQAVFPNRFPPFTGRFEIPTLVEELKFIRGLNRSTGRVAGIYPEIKQPAFHHTAGKDITAIVLRVLNDFGYTEAAHPCFLQCFDATELRRVRNDFHSRLRLIQLLEREDWLSPATPDEAQLRELREIASYAQGIGPPVAAALGLTDEPAASNPRLVRNAHAAGLQVHPWTYRADALPAGVTSFEELHLLSHQAGVDGLFTDFPDRSRAIMAKGIP